MKLFVPRILVASSLVLASCTASRAPVGIAEASEARAVFADVEHGEELAELIDLLVAANENCDFPALLRARIPDPPDSWAAIDGSKSRYCLGELSVDSATVEVSDLVAVTLLASRNRESYVVFASLRDDWSLSWPAPLGPPLHGESRAPE